MFDLDSHERAAVSSPEKGGILVASAASMRAHIIPAVFEDGVLKPEKELPLKDREHVQIAVLPKAAWARALGALLRRIHSRPSAMRPSQIEDEISLAAREARRLRRRR
jgi:predicted DNA-binding antitoxin AbrB/MazE fold protein